MCKYKLFYFVLWSFLLQWQHALKLTGLHLFVWLSVLAQCDMTCFNEHPVCFSEARNLNCVYKGFKLHFLWDTSQTKTHANTFLIWLMMFSNNERVNYDYIHYSTQARRARVPNHKIAEQRTQPHTVQCFCIYFKIICSYITQYRFHFHAI